MNYFLVGDLKPLCKILRETSSLPTAWGNRAASSSREIPVVCFEDTGGKGHLRDDQEGLFWLLARGALGIPHLLWQVHLHGHRGAELSAASLLRNGNTVGIASRARMSCLSSKPAQPPPSAAQLLGTMCILFRLGVHMSSFILPCGIQSSVLWLIYHFVPKRKSVVLLSQSSCVFLRSVCLIFCLKLMLHQEKLTGKVVKEFPKARYLGCKIS